MVCVLGHVGSAYRALGDYASALRAQLQVITEKGKLGDKVGAAATGGNMVSVYHATGNSAKGLELHRQALAELDALGPKQALPSRS